VSNPRNREEPNKHLWAALWCCAPAFISRKEAGTALEILDKRWVKRWPALTHWLVLHRYSP
jgi:hypothetical protein